MKIVFTKRQAIWIVACLLPAVAFFIIFPDYILKHTFFWVCILTMPVSIIRDSTRKSPYFLLCLLIGLLTLLLPTTIGIYVFICSMILFVGQQMMGGIHMIGLAHAFLASPFFTYLSSLISFPIRLQLTKLASGLLTFSGIENQTDGNLIQLNNHTFLVDQACSGMYLLGYGILFGTLILSARIRASNIHWKWLILYYLLLILLIIWGNLVRIYFLVVFNIEVDHWMHDGVGLIIYVLQILLPFYLIVRIGSNRTHNPSEKLIAKIPALPGYKYGLLLILLGTLFISVRSKKYDEVIQRPTITLKGFTTEVVAGDVTKLNSDNALIYLKSPVAAYSADHNPMVCWSGSGYEFQKVEKVYVDQFLLNVAELKNDEGFLHTAWWFESSESKTGDQWEWRVNSLKNDEQFYLVNVTCNTRNELMDQLLKLGKIKLIPEELQIK